jgi:enoyl-CoA hydratase/carnithine racemase
MTDLVRTRLENAAFIIELNRPDRRNALASDMLEAFLDALHQAEQAGDARIVVLRGVGKHFCTGLDLDEFYKSASATESDHHHDAERLAEILLRLMRMEKPTLGLVQGRALGVGATLAVSCDIVIAAAGAQLAFPEVSYGFVPAFAAAVLRRHIGDKAAFELVATGRTLTGEDARVMGLVSRVVPDEGFDAVSGSTIRGLCKCAMDLLTEVKRSFLETEGKSLEEALRISAVINARARASASFREAAKQFLAMA